QDLVRLPDEVGHHVGDGPDLGHPADDLTGRHRHHVRLARPHEALDGHGGRSGSSPVNGRRTPLGRPDVPEVYTMGAPVVRGSGRPAVSAPSSVSGVKPVIWPAATLASGSIPAWPAASAATATNRSWATNA